MKRKHFILALVAMLMSFSFSAYADDVIVVHSWAELKAAIEANDGVQRSAARQRSTAMRTTSTASEGTKTLIEGTPYYYEDFQTSQIKLGSDVVYDDAMPISKNNGTTLDLNGYKVLGSESAEHAWPFYNYGKFLVVDNSEAGTGAIYCGVKTGIKEDGISINEEAVFVMTGGNIICTHDSEDDAAVVNYGIAYITGGTIEGANNAVLNQDGATMDILAGVLISGDVQGTGINAAPGVYTVAQIGTTKYGSLQAAIDAAVNGDEITLVTDASGDVIVTQAPGVKFTIDGKDKKFTGTITVDGKSARYETAGLTIKNVNFDATAGVTYDACVRLGAGTDATRYTNNVTIEGCTFTDNDYSTVAIKSYTGGDYNVQIIDCTAEGMHSLAQLMNVEKGLVISGNTVNTKNGINLNQTYTATITDNEINVKGYAVRAGVDGSTGGNITLTDNTLKTDNSEGDPAIELRGIVEALNMEKNVVSGDTHIKGTATTIAVDANYWDGDSAPRVADTPISVNSYYSDASLADEYLMRNASGSINAFVSADRITGDVTSNAANSLVIEVIGTDGNVIGKVELENEEYLIGTAKQLTWRINLGADDNGSWAMTWNEGAPSITNMPAKVKLYVDGKEKAVAEAPVKFTANGDGASPVFAAKTTAEDKILSFIAFEGYNKDNTNNVKANAKLAEAVAAAESGDIITLIADGEYTLPVFAGKDLTITGAVDGVVFDNIGAKNMDGADVTFNNVTFDYYPNVNYTGLQHSGNLVYNNCTINGQVFLYGQSETFNKCTFNQESADAYNVWTYGAKEVVFNECTFNSAGKSVLVYTEDKNHNSVIAVTASTFNASQAVDGKAAIEMDASLQVNGGITLTVDAKTTAEGFSENTLSGNSLWNDKKVVEGKYNGGTNTEVIVDGVVVKEAAARGLAGEGTAESPYLISNLVELIWFAEDANTGNNYAGKFVKLTADINLNSEPWTPIATFNGTFDGNNKTISNLVVNGEGKSNQGFFGQTNNGEIKNLTINNAKVAGRLNVGVVAGTPYTSKYTNIKVTGNVIVEGMAYVGGVGGKNAYANWTDITVNVNDDSSYVKATSTENGTEYRTYVGGVIGFNGEGDHTFKNISSNIKVIGDVMDIGGIFGILHYNNNAENITFTGSVKAPAGAKEVGAIAGVWHNQKGTDVEISDITSTGTVTVGGTVVEGAVVGGAYNASNVTPGTSGSLKIDGEEAWLSVAKIGETNYRTVAAALAAAKDRETVTLLWNEGDPAIAMNGAVFGKKVTITGTATVDWSKGFLFVGRGGEGNATVTFDGANLTSASNSASTGIHVSGREKGTDNKYDGIVVIRNSTIDLDYLINKGTMSLDNSTLTVKNGFSIGGRPASETESGEDATATIGLANNSKVIVNNHNGMGLGYEALGIMDIDATSTFEVTQNFLVTAKGTMNIAGKASVTGTLTNKGAINLTDKAATLTATAGLTVNTDVADYKVAYIENVYKLVEKDYIAQVGDQKFEVFTEALDAVGDGGTITLLGGAFDESDKEIDFTKAITFTITGAALEAKLPVITFQNANVNIKDAQFQIPELDARQNATIYVDHSTIVDAGGNSIVKSYYNGKINITNNSTVYAMQVTTMGYIYVDESSTLNATWQTNVYGNGIITLSEGAKFNTAALHLTAQDYSNRDNTDAVRVGKPATIVVDGANLTIGKVKSYGDADYSYNSSKGINVGTVDGKSAVLDIKNGGAVNIYMANGETANIGAGATVNVDASTLNVACRAADGTATLANAGTVNVSGASNIAAAKVTGAGWFYMNGVTLNANTKLLGAKVRFAKGTNNIEGSVINDGFFQVGIGAYNGVDANVDTENGVVVNVKNNATVGSNGDTYAGWVGTGYYDTDAEKAAAMTDAKYVLNIDNSIAEFGYLHVSNDGELNVSGVPVNKAHYNNSDYAFYAGDFIINGAASFTATDVLAFYTKVSCDNGTDKPGTLNINAGTEYEAERHNGAVATSSNFTLYKTGVVNVAEGADLQACEASSIAANATLNIAGSVTALGTVTANGAINFTAKEATLAAQEGLTINHSFGGGYQVERIDGVYRISHYVASVDGVNYESLEAALKALTNGATLTLLENITVTEVWDCRSNGAKVTAANVTIDGAGKTLKLTGAVDDKNWNTVFRFEGDNATVKNLTIDASAATGIQRGITAKFSITVDKCTISGNGTTAKFAIIYGEGASASISNVVATVTNSTFTNWSYGVSDNQNGKDAKSVTISGNTFENASVLVSASENVTFKNNELTGAYVNITSYTNPSELLVYAAENALDGTQVNQITVDPSGITAQGGFSTPVAKVDETVKYYLTLDKAIAAANGNTVTVLDDIILSEAVEVKETAAVLNLNGNSIIPVADATMTGGPIRLLTNADLTIIDETGKGEISNNGNENVYAAVSVLGNNVKLTVNGGKLTGHYYGIAGNGYKTGTEVIINGGVIAGNNADGLGIYHPQNGTLTVTDGEITGATGIYFKGGKLDIQGGTIKGTGEVVEYAYNGSGCVATGDALVIENASAKGYAAIDGVSITGGTFISDNAAPVASYAPEASDALVEFIGEGCNAQFYSDNIDENLLVIGYQLKDEDNDGYYGVMHTYHRESMTIVDGAYTEFVNEAELSVGTLTYDRTLSAVGNWYPLYVPFEIPVEALNALGYEAAFFYDVHFEVGAGGIINPESAPDVHLIKIKQGTLKANFPYVIRAKANADLNLSLVLENTTLFTTAEDKMNSVESGSTINRFIFAGTYKKGTPAELTGDANVPCYVISNRGTFGKLNANTSLLPFRVFMYIIAKDGSPVILNDVVAESIRMRVIGEENEDGTTTIYDVEADEQAVDNIYDLQGRRVLDPQKGSLYIVNGKKIVF